MDPIVKAPVRKQGIVEKLGGQQGGHRTWKARYFVLTDQLAYYNKQADYASGASPNLIRLSAYFVSATETFRKKGEAKPKGGFFEFQIHAYPKSMTCRTKEEVSGRGAFRVASRSSVAPPRAGANKQRGTQPPPPSALAAPTAPLDAAASHRRPPHRSP